MTVRVSEITFNRMERKISAMQLTKGYASGTVSFRRKEYVLTGSISGPKGVYKVFGYQVLPIQQYSGTPEPLEYNKHFGAVTKGKRERCYRGMKTRVGKRSLVFVGDEVEFVPGIQGIQMEMFSLKRD